MNTNEFYKELMSEFSFDHEKIKKIAMGKSDTAAKSAKRSRLKITVAAAAAAAVVLTAGTFTAISVLGDTGTPIVIMPSSSMSAQERIRLAQNAYKAMDEKDTEEAFFYVTFEGEVTPESMQKILSAADSTGKIKVVSVYRKGGVSVSGNDSIKELFEANSQDITAVKIKCPGNLLKVISDLPEVFIVEMGDGFDDFSVIEREDPVPTPGDDSSDDTTSSDIESSVPDETSPAETSTPPESSDSSEPESSDSSSVDPSSMPDPVIGESAKELCFISDDTLAVIFESKIEILTQLGTSSEPSDKPVTEFENASLVCHGEGYAVVSGTDSTVIITLDENGMPVFEEYNGVKAADAAYVSGKLVICDGTKLYTLGGGEAAETAAADSIVDVNGSYVVFTSADGLGFYNAEADTVQTISGAAGVFAGGTYTVNVAGDDGSTLVLFCDVQGKELAKTVLSAEEDTTVEAISADGGFAKIGGSVYSIADGTLTLAAEDTEVSFEKPVKAAYTSSLYAASIAEGNVEITPLSE